MPLNLHLPPMSATGKMPVPQRVNFSCGIGILPVHKKLIENGARSQFKLTFCTNSVTGKMPVPQRVNFLVEQASCLFIKGLLRMAQDLSLNQCPMPDAQCPIPHSLFPIENPKPEKVSPLPSAPPKQLK
jgi:hypothetical protein